MCSVVCFGRGWPRGLRVTSPQRSWAAEQPWLPQRAACSLQPVAWGCPAISGIWSKGELSPVSRGRPPPLGQLLANKEFSWAPELLGFCAWRKAPVSVIETTCARGFESRDPDTKAQAAASRFSLLLISKVRSSGVLRPPVPPAERAVFCFVFNEGASSLPPSFQITEGD